VLCLDHSSRNRVDAIVILHFVQSLRKFLNQGQGTAWLIATDDIRHKSFQNCDSVFLSKALFRRLVISLVCSATKHTIFFSINIKNNFGSKKLYSVCTVVTAVTGELQKIIPLSVLFDIFPTRILASAFIYTNNGAMYPINIQSSRKTFQ